MGPIDPIRPVRLISRQPPRPDADAAQAAEPPVVNVTVNVAANSAEAAPTPGLPPISPEAHVIAQNARQRGLRGGQKVLETARSTYLGAQWSGPNDRRIATGKITKTDV